MKFFGKGKKGRKSAPQQAEPPAIDFSSEENMAMEGRNHPVLLRPDGQMTDHLLRSAMAC